MTFLQYVCAFCAVSLTCDSIVYAFPANPNNFGSMNIAESFGSMSLPFLFRRQDPGACMATTDCSCSADGTECDLDLSWMGPDESSSLLGPQSTKNNLKSTKGGSQHTSTHKGPDTHTSKSTDTSSQRKPSTHRTSAESQIHKTHTPAPRTSKAPNSSSQHKPSTHKTSAQSQIYKTHTPAPKSSKAPQTTSTPAEPLCIPGQNNGAVYDGSCMADLGTYCVCTSGSSFQTYYAVSGSNPCPYTALPSKTYNSAVCPPPPTPTAPPPSPSPPPKPSPSPTAVSPPPTTRDLVIMYNNYLLESGRGPVVPNHVWKAWDVTKTAQFDACDTSYVYRGLDNGAPDETVTQNDQFPLSIGPFNIQGHSNCNYKGPDHNTAGTLTCDGGFSAGCQGYPKSTQNNVISCATDIFGGSGENGESSRLVCAY